MRYQGDLVQVVSVTKGVAVTEPSTPYATSHKPFGGIYDIRQIDAVVGDIVLGFRMVQFFIGRRLQW